jgi:cell fate (sporulation/competence/biofilm development) regulator YlbF (YheA/YmcA/DUF963 family)
MQDTQALVSLARQLGEALAAHPTVRDYRAAQRAVRDDESARQLLEAYQTQAARIHQLEQEQEPIEVADKQALREHETKLSAHATLKNLMRHQADYVQLMSQVNQAMEAPLAYLAAPESTE